MYLITKGKLNKKMEDKYINLEQVMKIVQLKHSSIYTKMKQGLFPKARKSKFTGRVRWQKSEVQAWLDAEYSVPKEAA